MAHIPAADTALREFHKLFKSPEICRTNFQGKKFYHFSPIEAWLLHEENGVRNVLNLIRAVYRGTQFPPTSTNILENPRLFAILVDMQCGHLFDVFLRFISSNEHLYISDLSSQYRSIVAAMGNMEVELPRKYKSDAYEVVLNDFEERRWAFLPLSLRYHREANCYLNTILPFFYKKEINIGGTAKVYHCKIQLDLVEPQLSKALERFRKNDRTYGAYVEFAVKSYMIGYEHVYREESNAFKGLRGQTELCVVKYLGEYYSSKSHDHHHHILLELGEKDLEEYMIDKLPPLLNQEIHAFWLNLFQVGFTLSGIHQLHHEYEDGNKHVLKGWHGDIKPENILCVHGQFKLADFGFAKFEKDSDKTELLGGTRSFGAPERDQLSNENGIRPTHSQAIDTWSLGCVFSVAATWVILGGTFCEAYRRVREDAIKAIHKDTPSFSHRARPYCDDAFHDGERVLPEVVDWHNHLRNSARTSDTISCLVLDLVDNEMLCSNPEDRLSSDDLKTKLEDILSRGNEQYHKLLDTGVLRKESDRIKNSLLEFDEDAPQSAQSLSQAGSSGVSSNPLAAVASDSRRPSSSHVSRMNRVGKSEAFSRIVYGKTAHREQVLKPSRLKVATAIPSHTAEDPQQSHTSGVKGKDVARISTQLPALALPLETSQISPNSRFTPSRTGTSATLTSRTAVEEEYIKQCEIWDRRTLWELFRNKVPRDTYLAYFIENRDIIFVVDSDPTMLIHWENVKTTLLTLAMKIGPLDEDGLDLRYSCGNHQPLTNVKGYDIRSKFGHSMDQIESKIHHGVRTDMCKTLSHIFDTYLKGPCEKRQTLIILTNGKWEGSYVKGDVERLIVNFIKRIRDKLDLMESRWYSIQFVSFGEDKAALERMSKLDDELNDALEDIIDVKPWNVQKVDQLILGSIDQSADEETSVTSPVSASVSPKPLLTTPKKRGKIQRFSTFFNRN